MRIARSLFVVLILTAAGFARQAEAQGTYGALAISVNSGAYGYGYNYDTKALAQGRAMAECGKHARDCKVYAEFQRACISIARGNSRRSGWSFGWAIGYPNDERPERALNECAAQDGLACKVVTQFCSGTQ